MLQKKYPAVFLDRDGTINVERDYLYRTEDFCFIDGADKAIRQLNDAGFVVVVVTNQSGVARGYYGEKDVERLHEYLSQQLAEIGAHVDGYYYCPHHPQSGQSPYVQECDCRKGKPGMLLQAARELDIDLSRSWMVGDKKADVDAGLAAGCRPVLVRTGHGESECHKIEADQVPVCDDLSAAVALILSNLLNK
ncbi:D-glycero-beta-D-manno-heptose 1,7-bisphosphate 7-phosphatase [Desulfuromonas acetoxidans]|uniref:D,D-heptose 1,7-bisphosphate phosphatase n=1 Tax=Desulfuromonas acetoxidans (strain DSM 684 / 11070) TaxID=281689 RepID=Q1JY70_DESA6|nr:D-glycero-beta-D-manno-heptose 1,7-bisphosphate 7-phosphatase [Desulfuromonas acetoxidans]EAT15126.1 D,D-heptose 1,7-bisphosphate phosphatase [Desulfuromonas acetoxidans DSM 684]MBF0643953.1 D-glycero-beta-D-manno-heptose 1,7-bisphosphate 7-phosphatase [Desulfuromonas acetoxidans]NVD23191.1 D-glycero-beta-D-manno-heptose 1,7-bisphosphate 7-phosphatase [Desulfuromonas acetoxidans]NVE15568.1 D-glycero-beta-D-manno-heptose 1,7-bisphosphate 7-phosphatase [Desulfuromonas acetoxidans]